MSQNQPLIQIFKWLEHVYYDKSWVEFTSMDRYFAFFALKLLLLHKDKFYPKKNLFTQKLFNYLGTF